MPRTKAAPAAVAAVSSEDLDASSPVNGKDKLSAETISELLNDETDMPLGEQLARFEARQATERPETTSSQSAESDEDEPVGTNEEPEQPEPAEQSANMQRVLDGVSTLMSRLAAVEQRLQTPSETEDEDEFEFDIGPVEEGYEPLKPALNKLGTQVFQEVHALKRGMAQMADSVRQMVDGLHVDRIRKDYVIDKKEEDEIVAWGKTIGASYDHPGQLEELVKAFRKMKGTAPKPRPRPAVAPNPPAKQTGSRTFDKDLVRSPRRDTYEDSFAKAVRATNERLRRYGVGGI